jgi:hypothetical protein
MNNLRSECCNASVRVENGIPDFIGDTKCRVSTCWYSCSKCGNPCNIQGEINMSDSKEKTVENVAPNNSVTVISAINGYIVEHLVELSVQVGEPPQYQKIQSVFESPEFDPDDLEAFQRVIFHLKDHFGVECGTDRRLDTEIYDPHKKGKKK